MVGKNDVERDGFFGPVRYRDLGEPVAGQGQPPVRNTSDMFGLRRVGRRRQHEKFDVAREAAAHAVWRPSDLNDGGRGEAYAQTAVDPPDFADFGIPQLEQQIHVRDLQPGRSELGDGPLDDGSGIDLSC